MKKYLAFIGFIFLFSNCSSTWNIRDLGGISVMALHHENRQEQYKDLKEEETAKTGLQAVLESEQKKNKDLIVKLQSRYNTVASIITSLGKIPSIVQMVKQIHEYQKKSKDLVVQNPEYLAIAIKSEIAMLKKINDLYKYIYLNAVVGSNFSLMSIEQRMSTIDYVIKELKQVRGLAYTVHRKLKYGVQNGLYESAVKEYNLKKFLVTKEQRTKITKQLKIW